MFVVPDTLMAADLPQMVLYCEIGRLVSGRGHAEAEHPWRRPGICQRDLPGQPEDVADTEQFLRIIQSVPSPKAEPFKTKEHRAGFQNDTNIFFPHFLLPPDIKWAEGGIFMEHQTCPIDRAA